MPKIRLKPNSPEFAETESIAQTRTCEMPGCHDDGEHKAPKNRALDEYYLFCTEHVREYNKAWNFFSGMSDADVQEHMLNSMYGDRPTWRHGIDGETPEEHLRRKAWQTWQFSEADPDHHNKAGQNGHNGQEHGHSYAPIDRNTPEYEAMAIMGLEPPLNFETLRARYRKLVKKHHPDVNPGCTKSEDLLKRINMAYTILKLAHEQFEILPQEK